jgi:hypothetical protein
MNIRQLILCFVLTLSIIFYFSENTYSQEPDTLVQRLMGDISDSLYVNSIQSLQDFNTRYELSDSIGPAGQWIYDQFLNIGYSDVVFDSFSWTPYVVDTSIVSRNIIVTKPGNSGSDSLVILGGHYDSINDWLSDEDPNAPAPGANDNATGIAGVLEIARLLEPLSFEKTIIFACFAGEEVGYGGSSHFTYNLRQQGIPILSSIILDMIGYQEPFIYFVNIDADVEHINEALRIAELAWTYDLWLNPRLTFYYYGSDHWILGTWGPSVLLIEDAQYPVIHSEWDVLDSLSIPYAIEITKLALASIVDIAKYATVGIETSNPDRITEIPKALDLQQNYPNPFNPMTTISFDIPGSVGSEQHINLSIYDFRGRRIITLIDSQLDPGSHKVIWNGRNSSGLEVSSGIYLYTLRSNEQTRTRKMFLLK